MELYFQPSQLMVMVPLLAKAPPPFEEDCTKEKVGVTWLEALPW